MPSGKAATTASQPMQAGGRTRHGNSMQGAGIMAIINGTKDSETLRGAADNDTINGLGGDDTLVGGSGNDFLNGDIGNDALFGGIGNDFLNGGTNSDVINGGTGVDTIDYITFHTGVTVNLLTGTTNDGTGTDTLIAIENVRGSLLDDEIFGNQAGNFLEGNVGAEFISAKGGSGKDTILGGSGPDKIHGDGDADTLTGGSEADTFVYSSASDSRIGFFSHDVIKDFEKGLDKIDVSAIDANTAVSGNQAFTIIGSQNFSDEGQISAFKSGGGTLVQFNITGNSVAEFEIFLENSFQLSASDFVL
jgi:Ca2+-binding RTX toxin-like protein